jgi:hypothetical protein
MEKRHQNVCKHVFSVTILVHQVLIVLHDFVPFLECDCSIEPFHEFGELGKVASSNIDHFFLGHLLLAPVEWR